MAQVENDVREQARQRLQKRSDLGGHVVAYVLINAMIVGVWAITGAGYFWPAWVLLGWGVGLALNVWDVFFRHPITDSDIEREVKRMQRS
jgi:hypothetical protein